MKLCVFLNSWSEKLYAKRMCEYFLPFPPNPIVEVHEQVRPGKRTHEVEVKVWRADRRRRRLRLRLRLAWLVDHHHGRIEVLFLDLTRRCLLVAEGQVVAEQAEVEVRSKVDLRQTPSRTPEIEPVTQNNVLIWSLKENYFIYKLNLFEKLIHKSNYEDIVVPIRELSCRRREAERCKRETQQNFARHCCLLLFNWQWKTWWLYDDFVLSMLLLFGRRAVGGFLKSRFLWILSGKRRAAQMQAAIQKRWTENSRPCIDGYPCFKCKIYMAYMMYMLIHRRICNIMML